MTNSFAILALKALDCLTVRMDVTAENIANAGTKNYRPLTVNFEQALARAAMEGTDAIASVSPSVRRMQPMAGSDALRLDLEMQTATATAARYGAIVNVLSRETQLQSLALSGVK